MKRDILLRSLLFFSVITAVLAIYVGFKSHPKGFFAHLSDAMFLWGLTLLCISLIYITRFFGILHILKSMTRFRPVTYDAVLEEQHAEQQQKRDPSLFFASLLLIFLSIPIYYLAL